MDDQKQVARQALNQERAEFLQEYEEWTELPMLVLGIAWLVLLIVDLLGRTSPFLDRMVNLIWVIFIIDFSLRLTFAPQKIVYLKKNWLTIVSLVIPVFRVFRVFRLIRIVRTAAATGGWTLVRVVGAVNRGMRALRNAFGRTGFGYVFILTALVTFLGAAAVFALENASPATSPYQNYGDALFWTAMMITTLGVDPMPETVEGRLLAFLLAVYGFAVFGYVTATLASVIIGKSSSSSEVDRSAQQQVAGLIAEMHALRIDIQQLAEGRMADSNQDPTRSPEKKEDSR